MRKAPMGKFAKVAAGVYEAWYRHGFKISVFKTPDKDWSYNVWCRGELKFVGARFKRKADAEAAASEEAVCITVPVTNLMSGKTFQEAITTPHYCSPSSESYWSS